jgi:hypothetical protein
MFRNLLLPTAHPTLTMAPEGTPQNVYLMKEGTGIRGHKNADPVLYID